jgi:2-methylisocitrate lyase-like PEP mutase family enzyme
MSTARMTLSAMIKIPQLVCVPVVFNAMTALMAERAGFGAAYVGGLSLGYLRAATEAALTPHDFAAVGIEIRTVSAIPLIMDAGCGWGDPVHLRRVVQLAESAGYDAVEIEDQVAPKRVHHHIGIEHLVPIEIMVAKIEEAVHARRDPGLLVIARTNAVRSSMEDALRRCDAYARAGADMLFPTANRPDDLRVLGERAPLPLMQMIYPDTSFAHMGLSHEDLISLNHRLLVDGITPFADMYASLAGSYNRLRQSEPNADKILSAIAAANNLVDLSGLLAIERRTTERDAKGI